VLATIEPPARETADNFGVSLSLGRVLIVGAPVEGGGVVYAFKPRTGAFARRYALDDQQISNYSFFGTTVLGGDSWIAATDPRADGGVGAVFVFDRASGRFLERLSNRSDEAQYGAAMARIGSLLLVTAEGAPHGGYVDVIAAKRGR
jgi:hypothetical protein